MEDKKSMFIIVEGIDRCGKNTQQDLIIEKLKDRVFHKVHYSALPFKEKDKLVLHSSKMYTQMFEMMYALKDRSINVIFNRSHLGETVYSPLYRGYSGDFVFDIEKKHLPAVKDQVYLITLINDPVILLGRDDGKSLSTTEDDIRAECEGFMLAHRTSKIKNKLLINVGTMGPEEVSNIIVDFLLEEPLAYNNQQKTLDLV